MLILQELNSMLPPAEIPACTEGYEGFYHLNEMSGSVEKRRLTISSETMTANALKCASSAWKKICRYLNDKYGEGTVVADIRDSYYNMKEKILPHMHLINNAVKAMQACGVTPR